jgi:hypothetical protein
MTCIVILQYSLYLRIKRLKNLIPLLYFLWYSPAPIKNELINLKSVKSTIYIIDIFNFLDSPSGINLSVAQTFQPKCQNRQNRFLFYLSPYMRLKGMYRVRRFFDQNKL